MDILINIGLSALFELLKAGKPPKKYRAAIVKLTALVLDAYNEDDKFGLEVGQKRKTVDLD